MEALEAKYALAKNKQQKTILKKRGQEDFLQTLREIYLHKRYKKINPDYTSETTDTHEFLMQSAIRIAPIEYAFSNPSNPALHSRSLPLIYKHGKRRENLSEMFNHIDEINSPSSPKPSNSQPQTQKHIRFEQNIVKRIVVLPQDITRKGITLDEQSDEDDDEDEAITLMVLPKGVDKDSWSKTLPICKSESSSSSEYRFASSEHSDLEIVLDREHGAVERMVDIAINAVELATWAVKSSWNSLNSWM